MAVFGASDGSAGGVSNVSSATASVSATPGSGVDMLAILSRVTTLQGIAFEGSLPKNSSIFGRTSFADPAAAAAVPATAQFTLATSLYRDRQRCRPDHLPARGPVYARGRGTRRHLCTNCRATRPRPDRRQFQPDRRRVGERRSSRGDHRTGNDVPTVKAKKSRSRPGARRARSGFSLVEVVLAMGVVVLFLLPTLGLVGVGLNSVQDSEMRLGAADAATSILNKRLAAPGSSTSSVLPKIGRLRPWNTSDAATLQCHQGKLC